MAVLPHGLDALLEKVVVGADFQACWPLDMVHHNPEFFDVCEVLQVDEAFLPVGAAAGLLTIVPHGPRAVQWVLLLAHVAS